MKRRIIFVDDEPMVLDALGRILRPLRGEWEMEFVGSGALALARMEQVHCDVVVSDMQMPGMNGAQLLSAVRARFPSAIRLILSGYASADLILQGVDCAHQYLAKPCGPDELRAVLDRIGGLEQALRSAPLRTVIGRLSYLPSAPSIYFELAAVTGRPGFSVAAVADVIGRDLGVTARVLRLVNSACFGRPRELSSVHEAIAHLGMDVVKALVLSVETFGQFESTSSGKRRIEQVWSHSVVVGAKAQQIARFEQLEARSIGHAHLAGLLHDVGKLVLGANLADDCRAADELAAAEGLEQFIGEERIFGASHAEVGGYLLSLWGLPSPVVEAVTFHHRPGRAGRGGLSPLTVVHTANVLAADPAVGAGPAPAQLDEAYLASAGVAARAEAWRPLFPDAPARPLRS